MKRDFGIYQVALKILLRKGNKVLLLRDSDGYWDLPGGRIDRVEAKRPLKKILGREIREELGGNLKYKLGWPLFQFRGYNRFKGIYIFKTVYDAEYISGSIQLSPEHSSYEWINPRTYKLRRKDFETQEEYAAYKEYFKLKNHA